MKIVLIAIGIFLMYSPGSQEIEGKLIKETWGEVNEYTTSYRGKAGLILVNFKADHTFESYETTCTEDNVLQRGKWKVKNDTLIFSEIKTKKFKDNSIRKGKILSKKDSGKIEYRIKELEENSLILESESATLHFKTTKINYFPKI